KVLPLDRSPIPTEYLARMIAFANIALVGFIAASLAARFIYPSLSAERGAFYLIGSAPLPLGRYLLYKYLFYLLPFTGLTLLLVTVSNHLLHITGPMWLVSLFLSLLMTWTTVAMALGFGVLFVDFRSENRVSAMGPGPCSTCCAPFSTRWRCLAPWPIRSTAWPEGGCGRRSCPRPTP
ncbi:MAG TPA: hypothetical protein VLR45_00055, partial [Desulfoprunum sp.]|nr:hypothetical protein [Desulfoprunum sp.]